MNKHTPEPWTTSMYKLPANTVRILGPLNKDETKSEWVGDLIGAQSLNHNAARIVACVNACAGIDHPEEVIRAMRAVKAEDLSAEAIGKLKLERDELRSVLGRVFEHAKLIINSNHEDYKQASELLAKQEGGSRERK